MLYGVQHITRFRYGTPVDLAVHLAHLKPRALPWQRVLHATLHADPPASLIRHGTDDFGNPVAWLFHDAPHPTFTLTMSATVSVQVAAGPAPAATPPWESVRDAAPAEWRLADFLAPSPRLPPDPGARDFAAASFPPGTPVLAGALDLARRIHRDFAFRPGSTTLRTPVSQVLAQRAGVCQDFTHLMIAALRSFGLPARYVSGYIRTRSAAGAPRMRGADASHAWVAVWIGQAQGWAHIDPTNDCLMGDGHVVLGWGRDYGDVSPVQGVLLGGGKQGLEVAVDLEPLDMPPQTAEESVDKQETRDPARC